MTNNNYLVLEQLDIEEVVHDLQSEVYPEYGLLKDVKKTGNNIMITCPYHSGGQEDNVSMGVTITDTNRSKKGTCHCFTCNKTVDLLTLISDVHGRHDFGMYGKKWVHKNYLIDHVREKINIVHEEKEEEETYISNIAVKKYAENIPDYVLNRGISVDVASYFNVGYDESDHTVTFPVYDQFGKCRFIQRRKIKYKFFMNDSTANKYKYLYGLYQLNEQIGINNDILDFSKLFITESIIDALYLWTYGYAAVAIMQSVPTKEQMDLIKHIPIKTIISATDNDYAGKKGTEVLRKNLPDKLVKRLVFPDYAKDVNDLTENDIKDLKTTIIF